MFLPPRGPALERRVVLAMIKRRAAAAMTDAITANLMAVLTRNAPTTAERRGGGQSDVKPNTATRCSP